MRSRYEMMSESAIRDEDGQTYPDIMTFNVQDFQYEEPPESHALSRVDIDRPDLLMSENYGYPEFDDLLLWINGIGYRYDLVIGDEVQEIFLPTRRDLELFYSKNRK